MVFDVMAAHDQYTNPLARPLLIALQVVRTSCGFHLRECMGSSFPPPPPPRGIGLIWKTVSSGKGSELSPIGAFPLPSACLPFIEMYKCLLAY